jgi:hypothetical protein
MKVSYDVDRAERGNLVKAGGSVDDKPIQLNLDVPLTIRMR